MWGVGRLDVIAPRAALCLHQPCQLSTNLHPPAPAHSSVPASASQGARPAATHPLPSVHCLVLPRTLPLPLPASARELAASACLPSPGCKCPCCWLRSARESACDVHFVTPPTTASQATHLPQPVLLHAGSQPAAVHGGFGLDARHTSGLHCHAIGLHALHTATWQGLGLRRPAPGSAVARRLRLRH